MIITLLMMILLFCTGMVRQHVCIVKKSCNMIKPGEESNFESPSFLYKYYGGTEDNIIKHNRNHNHNYNIFKHRPTVNNVIDKINSVSSMQRRIEYPRTP